MPDTPAIVRFVGFYVSMGAANKNWSAPPSSLVLCALLILPEWRRECPGGRELTLEDTPTQSSQKTRDVPHTCEDPFQELLTFAADLLPSRMILTILGGIYGRHLDCAVLLYPTPQCSEDREP